MWWYSTIALWYRLCILAARERVSKHCFPFTERRHGSLWKRFIAVEICRCGCYGNTQKWPEAHSAWTYTNGDAFYPTLLCVAFSSTILVMSKPKAVLPAACFSTWKTWVSEFIIRVFVTAFEQKRKEYFLKLYDNWYDNDNNITYSLFLLILFILTL